MVILPITQRKRSATAAGGTHGWHQARIRGREEPTDRARGPARRRGGRIALHGLPRAQRCPQRDRRTGRHDHRLVAHARIPTGGHDGPGLGSARGRPYRPYRTGRAGAQRLRHGHAVRPGRHGPLLRRREPDRQRARRRVGADPDRAEGRAAGAHVRRHGVGHGPPRVPLGRRTRRRRRAHPRRRPHVLGRERLARDGAILAIGAVLVGFVLWRTARLANSVGAQASFAQRSLQAAALASGSQPGPNQAPRP